MFQPRTVAWRARPIRALLDADRIRRVKWHLQNSFGRDPESFRLPVQPKAVVTPMVAQVRQPFNAVAIVRKYARQQFVTQQLARMDDIIADWKTRRREQRQELRAKQQSALLPRPPSLNHR
jgi:hypothetical protein